jgi:hypothetical protein
VKKVLFGGKAGRSKASGADLNVNVAAPDQFK